MTVCLSMIVKNESHCIGRCLAAVRPHVDCYAISDTGSEDGTPELIAKSLEGMPGLLSRDAWVDFRTNRNLALSRAVGDWVLLIDADEEMVGGPDLVLDPAVDGYLVSYSYGGHWLTRVVKNDGSWSYAGPTTHEVLVSSDPSARVEKLESHQYVHHADSSRRKSGQKFLGDILLLLREVRKNPSDSRAVFYLAESYRFQGDAEKALFWHRRRSKMPGFAEETYWSKYQTARLQQYSSDEARVDAYLAAWAFRPGRQEALYDLCLFLRSRQRWPLIYALTRDQRPTRTDLLCVDLSAEWKVLEECGVALYNLGQRAEASRYFRRVLSYPLGAREVERTRSNLAFCEREQHGHAGHA